MTQLSTKHETALEDERVIVRSAGVNDAEASWRLFQAHLNWINVWFKPDQVVQRQVSLNHTFNLFSRFPSAVVETEGVVVGFASTQSRELGILEIVHLYVADPYRGRGLATKLLINIEMQARAMDVGAVLATSSGRYYPSKVLPESTFKRAEFEVHDLAPGTQLYMKRLNCADSKPQHVRHIALGTVTELSVVEPPATG